MFFITTIIHKSDTMNFDTYINEMLGFDLIRMEQTSIYVIRHKFKAVQKKKNGDNIITYEISYERTYKLSNDKKYNDYFSNSGTVTINFNNGEISGSVHVVKHMFDDASITRMGG
jgi:hypothetical protein